MKQRILYFMLATLVAPFAHAADDVSPRLLKGQEQMLSRDYPAALATFQSLERDFPESPAGSFGIMATWQLRMFENRDFQYTQPYSVAAQKMEVRCEKRLFSDHPDDWDLLVCGTGYGMKSFYDARQEKWLRSLSNTQRSIRAFRRLLWQNPKFIDVDVGIGGYEFWRSVVTQQYRWLPFFSDQRATGMAKVERVMREGTYARDIARANLAYMQIEMKQYDAGLENLRIVLAKYPNNILLRQTVGDVAWSQKRYKDCFSIFSEILRADPTQTRSLYWMAACSVTPYLTVDGHGQPREDIKLPNDVATRGRADLHQYLASNPISPWAAGTHIWLAVIAECQGDKATAITEYNEALKLDPDKSKEIKLRLARLQ